MHHAEPGVHDRRSQRRRIALRRYARIAADGNALLPNASRVGGTALAAYPLFRLRTGIVHHLEAVVDLPSQIAESGLNGAGLYPRTQLGYGLSYTAVSNARLAAAFGAEVMPPSSRFTVNETQPRYVIDFTVGYHVLPRATLSAIATGSSSRQVGFNQVNPAAAIRMAYDSSVATQFSTDVGARVVTRHSVAQSYGDVAVSERLRKNMTFAVGLGTTFNPVSNAKLTTSRAASTSTSRAAPLAVRHRRPASQLGVRAESRAARARSRSAQRQPRGSPGPRRRRGRAAGR